MNGTAIHDGPIREFAPAKINLTLAVAGRRSDGYHEIESLVAFAGDIGDEIALMPGRETGLVISGLFAHPIAGENLIARILRRLHAIAPQLELGVIALTKEIPVAAGLGGGSADAAAVLRAVRQRNPQHAGEVDWHTFAVSLGSDVPVCLAGEPALIWGRGENVLPLGALPSLPVVLVNPMVPVPADKTARVFRRLAAPPAVVRETPPMPPGPFADAGHLVDYMIRHGNDLEAPACDLVPEIEIVRAALAEAGECLLVRVTGAGPTCFGVFPSTEKAQAAAQRLSAQFPNWWVRQTAVGSRQSARRRQ
ncbi:MAG: 4-(cytidine 5'-diphospho)-2-C-methyl-D-erythritol kinase [Hyphomicrobiaceae bacterium]